MKDLTRLEKTQMIAIIAMLAGIFSTFELWHFDRLFPSAPLFSWMPRMGPPEDMILVSVTIVLMVSTLFVKRSVFIIFMLIFSISTLLVFDENRWQPWVFQYYIILVIMLKFPNAFYVHNNVRPVLTALTVAMAAVYFWSGMHKLLDDHGYLSMPFVYSAHEISLVFDAEHEKQILSFVPYFELLLGVSLLIKPIRSVFAILGIILHVGILVFLGFYNDGQNDVAWSWNIAMALILFFVYFKSDVWLEDYGDYFTRPYYLGVFLLAWGVPLLSMTGTVNPYLGFDMNAGLEITEDIGVKMRRNMEISPEINEFVYIEDTLIYFDINRWSFDELNTPPCPTAHCHEMFEEELDRMIRRR